MKRNLYYNDILIYIINFFACNFLDQQMRLMLLSKAKLKNGTLFNKRLKNENKNNFEKRRKPLCISKQTPFVIIKTTFLMYT